MKGKAPAWLRSRKPRNESKARAFERLVARIEAALSPAGARIKSPDHVPDLVTGTPREVDATIRHRVGSSDILITVECRDRSRGQDVTWIEHLVQKKVNIGASRTIAVSSKGFSTEAIDLAQRNGISTHVLKEISDVELLGWANKLEVKDIETQLEFGQLRLVFVGTHPDLVLAASSWEAWNAHGLGAPIFLEKSSGKSLSLEQLLEREAALRGVALKGNEIKIRIPPKSEVRLGLSPLSWLGLDAPADGTAKSKTVWLAPPSGAIAFATTTGILDLERIGVDLTCSASSSPVGVDRLLRYSSHDRIIIDVAERTFPAPDGSSLLVSSYKEPDVNKK